MSIQNNITITSGEDWSLSIDFHNDDDTAATVTGGYMQVRKGANETVLLTPTVSASGSTLVASLSKTATVSTAGIEAEYDLFATVNGSNVKVCYGSFCIVPSISVGS